VVGFPSLTIHTILLSSNDLIHPLLRRALAVLSYLRLHLPQEFGAAWFGMEPYDVSCDLRLLPLIDS
jgi:hypothetical protein